jgi:hypothetical protein
LLRRLAGARRDILSSALWTIRLVKEGR